MTLTNYRPLGRSGLIVSPLCLGAMTFGTGRWGADRDGSRSIWDAYVGAGGNFIDTADVYSSGASEEMVGEFIADERLRDRIVLATKFGWSLEKGRPPTGGNGAKHVRAALDASLRRLRTDHVDLYWVHVWDQVTPVDEVLDTLASLTRAGKIRYYGLSNVPGWYAAAMATLAAERGLPGPIALQYEYSLVERGVEYELAAAARELGMGLCPWSPLGGGFLTGKYRRGETPGEDGRLSGANPFGDSKFTDRNWDVLDAVRAVSDELGRTPAEVSLAWVAARPGVDSVLIGASRAEQVAANVASLDVAFTPEQLKRLNEASTPPPIYPFALFSPVIRKMVFGGQEVADRAR